MIARYAVTALTLASLLASSPALLADSRHRYQAELVLVERRIDPSQVEERMETRRATDSKDVTLSLWVEDEQGEVRSNVTLLPADDMHLRTAVQRLQRTGRFNILMQAAWIQDFPPDYQGEPLRVSAGPWLPGAHQRAIEGTIRIDRLRFLHVNAVLNHWQEGPLPVTLVAEEEAPREEIREQQPATVISGAGYLMPQPQQFAEESAPALPLRTAGTELITWLNETRRMRSDEIHLLDSPTLSLLVYFRRVN